MPPAVKSTAKLTGLVGVVLVAVFIVILALSRLVWQLPAVEQTEAAVQASNSAGLLDRGPLVIDTPVHTLAEWDPARPREFGEAPGLRRQVEAGALPPVEERLPENPQVVIPIEQHGPYGGAWNRFATGVNDIPIVYRRICYDGLVRWDPTGTRVFPNLAVDWEITGEGRVFTFHLRRGVRWSDGEPFTSADLLFWYEQILGNSRITPAVPTIYQPGGDLMEMAAIDDYTIEFRFSQPNGLFLEQLASGHSKMMLTYPRHYLKNYHPDFVPEDELVAAARARNLRTWQDLFFSRYDWRDLEKPTLNAWMLTRPPPSVPVIFERNPYYWKVDDAGNQLPYIDRLTFLMTNTDILNMRLLAGESHMQSRHLNFANYPLFMENQDEFNFRVHKWPRGGGGILALAPNINHQDPVMAEILGDSRFRKALSHAIDRAAISEISYHGMGTPRQIAPPPTSLFYDPDYERAYIEFDLEKANRLLDEMGLTERNSRGLRLRPDGRPLYLQLEHTRLETDYAAFELIAETWGSLGIGVRVREQAREIFVSRINARQHDITVWGSQNEQNPLMSPHWFLPVGSSHQAPSYGRWFNTGGRQGEKPGGDILRCMEVFWEIEQTIDPERRVELFREIIDLNRRNLWIIGLLGELPQLVIVRNDMRNVPERAMDAWIFRTPGNTAPESYAIDPNGG